MVQHITIKLSCSSDIYDVHLFLYVVTSLHNHNIKRNHNSYCVIRKFSATFLNLLEYKRTSPNDEAAGVLRSREGHSDGACVLRDHEDGGEASPPPCIHRSPYL